MASAEFHEAVVYALSCVGRQNVTLITVKPKQEEALVVHFCSMYTYDRRTGRVCLVPHWLWKVVVLSVAGLRV